MRREGKQPTRGSLLETETLLNPLKVESAGIQACVLYPNNYYTGMSSLAVHALYGLLNGQNGIACQRAFLPSADEQRWLHTHRDRLGALETRTPLAEFDLLAVTTSFELDWLNLPLCLQLGGIPPLRRDREDEHPFVLGGGPCFTANPLPILALFDAVYIGEVEPALPTLQQLTELPRSQWAEYLSQHPGFLVPDMTETPVTRQYAQTLGEIVTASEFLTPYTEFKNTYLVEMSRGCGRSCSFCLAGQIYRPVRNRRVEALLSPIQSALQHTRRIGIVSASVSDYPWLEQFCRELMQIAPLPLVSVSSMRADGDNGTLFELLAASGQQSVTFAPETGTETLRQSVCKGLSDEALIGGITKASEAGLTSVKLYFLVGLPGETEYDRTAIVSLVERLTRDFSRCFFNISINPFVPKPHTALQAAEVPDYRTVRKHLASVSTALCKLPRVRVRAGSARWAAVQTAISRGDERLTSALVAASLAQADFSTLHRLFAEAGSSLEAAGRAPTTMGHRYPWDIIVPQTPAPSGSER